MQTKELLQVSDNNNTENSEDSSIKVIDEKSFSKTYFKKKKIKSNKENESKKVKVKELCDDKFINDYDPQLQNNKINPKLKFFIDCQSLSESDKELSSPSVSKDSSSYDFEIT